MESCPVDCRAVCGDGACTHAEDVCSCADDCDECGDGECSWAEAGAGACAADCPGASHFVRICAGTFAMGSPEGELGRDRGEARHEVTLTRDFEIRSAEVTQAEFEGSMGYNPSGFAGCADCPVDHVSWHEAAAYCNALSDAGSLGRCYDCAGSGASVTCGSAAAYATPYECPGYRLPTEAEWEYAARAGTTTATYTGDLTGDPISCDPSAVLEPIAWWCDTSEGTTHEVGLLDANAWGLNDVLGNVSEWCHDWFGEYGGAATDPWGPGAGSDRVIRGGYFGSFMYAVRAAGRDFETPDRHFTGPGLRVSRSLEP
jgi:formylglycine-generating enzyme required for sulfatase activity